MTVEAQGAPGSQQSPFGADMGRLQEQQDGSDLPAGMKKAITEPHLGGVSHFQPFTLRKHKQKCLFSYGCEIYTSAG